MADQAGKPAWWRSIPWWLTKTVLGAFVGGMAFQIFLEICDRLGWRPRVWLVDLALKYVTPDNVELALLIVSGIVGLVLMVLLDWIRGSVLHAWGLLFVKKQAPEEQMPEKRIAMNDAARTAYEETRGGVVAQHAESDISEGRILPYYADIIGRKVPIQGTRPPSRKPEVIDPALFKSVRFTDDANALTYILAGEPTFTNITVAERDLAQVIAELKTYGTEAKPA